MKSHQDFEKRVNRSLNHMEAKLSYLRDGVKGLNDAFQEFREEMGEYMVYTAEKYSEHEKRIKRIEKELNL